LPLQIGAQQIDGSYAFCVHVSGRRSLGTRLCDRLVKTILGQGLRKQRPANRPGL
jgi:hypothetical protein